MKNLIVYFSRKGSTLTQVEKLAAKLQGESSIASVKDNPSLEDYDNIILGGAVLAGEIKGGMKKFTEKNMPILLSKKVGLFVCCLDKSPENIEKYFTKTFSEKLVSHCSGKENLGGCFQLDKENFLIKILMKVMGSPDGEQFIDENIDKLANSISP